MTMIYDLMLEPSCYTGFRAYRRSARFHCSTPAAWREPAFGLYQTSRSWLRKANLEEGAEVLLAAHVWRGQLGGGQFR